MHTRVHTSAHRHVYKCVASLPQRSSSRQWQRHLSLHTHIHSHTHTHTHGYQAASHASLSLSSPSFHVLPFLSSIMPKCSYLRNERRIALHRIACPFFVLRLTFACWLTGYGYGYAFERFKFHIATALPPPCHAHLIAALRIARPFLNSITCHKSSSPKWPHAIMLPYPVPNAITNSPRNTHTKTPFYFGFSRTSFRPDFICFPLGYLKVKIVLCAFLKVNPFCNVMSFWGLSLWSYLCDRSFNSLGTIQAYCNKTCFAFFTLTGICILCQ